MIDPRLVLTLAAGLLLLLSGLRSGQASPGDSVTEGNDTTPRDA